MSDQAIAVEQTQLSELEMAVEGFFVDAQILTPEKIRDRIAKFRPLFPAVSDDDVEDLAKMFEARHGVIMEIGEILRGDDDKHEPWLDAAKVDIDPYYWGRYRKLLAGNGFSGNVLVTLDDVTDRILGEMGDPNAAGPWDRRGMVVGHVQSGKTANYSGLICKAADAGYKLIVVIAGIHNNLRNQTQLRIDEGFVGRDSARLLSKKGDRAIGVGKFDQSRCPVTFTNSVKDFNKAMATGVGIPLQTLNQPAVFVIKKNPSTLKNLTEWLVEHSGQQGGAVDVPMLLIDDEADNASINIRYGKDGASRINSQLRELLKKFKRSCYIGYTATPFANIFIDPDTADDMYGADLFPHDFIVSLDPPSNYFGAGRVFIDEANEIVRHIDDNEDHLPLKHKIDYEVVSLPPSMIRAMRTFIVARAIRLHRGHANAHCSMLVNASRFTATQGRIRSALHLKLQDIQASVRTFGGLPVSDALGDPELALLHKVWEQEFSNSDTSWKDVQKQLLESIAPIKVVEVNSASSGTLNYADHEKTGLSVIAVGGLSLSRGLTLEGLMISYFLRNSMMYDTLMQMGRWFGYRHDYDDLCRVWMLEEAEGWYSHIAESIELLRDELRTMAAAGATPRDFGLKVRSHPETLLVTARNKMGSGEKVVVSVGLGNNFIETTSVDRRSEALEANRETAKRFAVSLEEAGFPFSKAEKVAGGLLLKGVPVKLILPFIGAYRNSMASMLTDPGPVSKYIEDREDNELASWDVFVPSKTDSEKTVQKTLSNRTILDVDITCQRRKPGKSTPKVLRVGDNQRVASRGVEKHGLTPEMIATAEAKFEADPTKQPGKDGTYNFPDRIYRYVRPRPLLILHLLHMAAKDEMVIEGSEPVVAWSISFPITKLEEKKVSYVVNLQWMRENYAEDLEDDDMDDDDD